VIEEFMVGFGQEGGLESVGQLLDEFPLLGIVELLSDFRRLNNIVGDFLEGGLGDCSPFGKGVKDL
jgi:hypothetical protein